MTAPIFLWRNYIPESFVFVIIFVSHEMKVKKALIDIFPAALTKLGCFIIIMLVSQ